MSDPDKPATAPGAPALEDSLPEPVRWIKENFEAVVVAFIMALVIRCFCLEVFKIPTASMEPTLLGDARDRSRGGDRIMVNKFAYEVGDVTRYDVLVFKFPLDLSRNFIKRCVGLPDEDIVFVGGDIYTRKGKAPFALARKPVAVQENAWIPVYSGGCEASAFRERWNSLPGTERVNWELHEGALRTFAGPGKPPETRFVFAPADLVVYDVERDRPGIRESPHPVPDLRLAARVEFLGPAGEFDLTLKQAEGTPRERTFRVVLRPGAPVLVQHPDRNGAPAEVELKASVKPQTPVDVALLVYDGACAVLLDGSVVHDQAWQTAPPPAGTAPSAARAGFGTRNAEVLVRNLAVARDLYYYVIGDSDPFPSDRPVHIPPACHLLIGDNLRNSHDGRAWRRREIEFVDGSTVYWDGNLFQDDARTSLFLKKSDTNPSQNEVGWAVPHERIRDIRQPRPRQQLSLADGSTVLWDTDLVEPLPGDGFALYARQATGERGGKVRTLSAGQVADVAPVPPVTWVERRHIVGKAFAIWWPPGRWFRLIR